ncbi:MAG: DUF2083 domain-containing protein [Rhodospirillales bacterium]|nr:DUF2083 domain-containing protein [Rhodospirillales bacterium]
MGLTQAALAREVGISASYLNLIEWNKRQIAGPLLRRTAEALDLSLDELDGAAERRLLESLTEIAHLPPVENLGPEVPRTGELIGRFPGWARGIATLARSERDARSRAQVLSDRLSNDPFLEEVVHRMLSRISAIRSSSEILTEFPDAPTERRDRFVSIIHEESQVLSDVGEALAAYLHKTDDPDRILTPLDEAEAFFENRQNHVVALEKAVTDLDAGVPDGFEGSRWQHVSALVDDCLDRTITDLIDAAPEIETAAARGRAAQTLRDYAASAVLMPMEPFIDRALGCGFDVDVLADAFSVDVERVCHRLTSLPPDRDLPRFGYYQANAAGTLIEMYGLEDLAVPRYASACPLWVLYRAQQSPEAFIRQRVLFPSGAHFVFVARARNAGPSGFGKPRHYLTDMIAMTEEDASQTVYGPDSAVPVEEVGPSCRLCPRHACPHRVEDPLAG